MRFIPLDRVGLLEQALAETIGSRQRRTVRRDALAIALGLHGLRIEEVCRSQAKDFSPTARTLHVKTIKRGVPRDVPLHQSLADALLAWRQEAKLGGGPLLPTSTGQPCDTKQLWRSFNRLSKKLFGEAWKFHALRHTFAMRVLVQTEDIMLVKKLLGHRSLASTQEYLDARKELPESCLVNLDSPFAMRSYSGAQLRLFTPAEETG
jgi:integrase